MAVAVSIIFCHWFVKDHDGCEGEGGGISRDWMWRKMKRTAQADKRRTEAFREYMEKGEKLRWWCLGVLVMAVVLLC